MQLVIKNDKVLAYHENDQNIKNLYPDCVVLIDNAWQGQVGDKYTITKKKRQELFENDFLLTSLGNYRLTPRGYANAQQSIDTINNIVNAMGSLTEQVANMIKFYQTPDFSKPEECSEEWLIEHQYSPNPMTKEQWTNFYIEFTTLYAQKQYQIELNNA